MRAEGNGKCKLTQFIGNYTFLGNTVNAKPIIEVPTTAPSQQVSSPDTAGGEGTGPSCPGSSKGLCGWPSMTPPPICRRSCA